MNADEVRTALDALRQHDLPTHGGRTLAYVYDSGLTEADALGREALAAYGSTNALDPTAFPSLLRMEQDLIATAAQLLDGPPETVGTVTSGGTESILLAVQTARDARPDIHAAHHGAAHVGPRRVPQSGALFRRTPIFVPVDAESGRAVASAMAHAIADDTVLVVASAPVVRPRGDRPDHPDRDRRPSPRGALSRRRLHRRLAAALPAPRRPRDSRVLVPDPGRDQHLGGPAQVRVHPQGSVDPAAPQPRAPPPAVLRDRALAGLHHDQLHLQSTKSGGPLAAAWAVTRFIGDEGYAALARQVRDGMRILVEATATLAHLRLLVPPDASLAAFAADGQVDVFTVCDELLAPGLVRAAPAQLRALPGHPARLDQRRDGAGLPELRRSPARGAVSAAAARGPVSAGSGGDCGAWPRWTRPRWTRRPSPDCCRPPGWADAGGLVLPARMAGVNALLDAAPVRYAKRWWPHSSISCPGLTAQVSRATRRPRRRPRSPARPGQLRRPPSGRGSASPAGSPARRPPRPPGRRRSSCSAQSASGTSSAGNPPLVLAMKSSS